MSFYAAAKPGVPVVCTDCGYEYPQDPIFEVDCPTCHAKVGQYCKRPSGHQGPLIPVHADRDLLAEKEGYYNHDCKHGLSGYQASVEHRPDDVGVSPLPSGPQLELEL